MPMAKTYTSLDLIAFLYRDMPSIEAQDLRRSLAIDAILNAEFQQLDRARKALPKATFAPSDHSIANILQYSHAAAARV